MQRNKTIWRATRASRALNTMSEIEKSVGALNDEDLLDLQDIFVDSPSSALAKLALVEMTRRNLTP